MNSFIAAEYNKVLNGIRYKDTYKKTKVDVERMNSEEGLKIITFLRIIFECVKKRYLDLKNPTNIMRKNICDCISILIITGITKTTTLVLIK